MSIPGAIADTYSLNNDCPICFMEVNETEIVTPCCNKQFHKVCYDKWLIQNPVCPLCRCAQQRPDVCIIQMPVELPVEAVIQNTHIPSIPSNSCDCTCYINCSSIRSIMCIIIAILCLFGFLGVMAYALISKGYRSTSSNSSNITSVPPSTYI